VQALDPLPHERIVEIGCGHGVAVDLVARRLDTGQVTGLDRSAKMIAMAARRNRAHVEAGRAAFVTADIEMWQPDDGAFDCAFAINVIVFADAADPGIGAVRRALAPEGRLVLVFQPPGAGDVPELLERFIASLEANRFCIQHAEGVDMTGGPVACVVARPG
jgi:ubiquinone/menaquinone biosynthesis C-methylase UbiE